MLHDGWTDDHPGDLEQNRWQSGCDPSLRPVASMPTFSRWRAKPIVTSPPPHAKSRIFKLEDWCRKRNTISCWPSRYTVSTAEPMTRWSPLRAEWCKPAARSGASSSVRLPALAFLISCTTSLLLGHYRCLECIYTRSSLSEGCHLALADLVCESESLDCRTQRKTARPDRA